MPYLKCNDCHHEFESTQREDPCDWCGATTSVLEEETPLEKMIEARWPHIKKPIEEHHVHPVYWKAMWHLLEKNAATCPICIQPEGWENIHSVVCPVNPAKDLVVKAGSLAQYRRNWVDQNFNNKEKS